MGEFSAVIYSKSRAVRVTRRFVMFRSAKTLLISLGLLTTLIGCSGSTGGPTIPQTYNVGDGMKSGTLCLGAWQVAVNKTTGEMNVYQARGSDLALNVVTFLEPPPLKDLSINFSTLVLDPPFLEVDVILTHPIPDPVFTGFDVRGIVFGPDVLNADGYTPYMRPDDFTSVPFGYKDGLLGAPDSYANYSDELNGYKYFADGLGFNDDLVAFFSNEDNLAQRGKFANGAKNARHYMLSWEGKPEPLTFLVFNYAVYANYDWPVGEPPITLDDFTISANSQEAFCFTASPIENTLYYYGGEGGGELTLSAELWDWQGFDDYDVTMQAGSVFGASPIHHDTTSPGSTSKSQIFTFTAVPGTPASTDDIDITIAATDKSATFGSSWFMNLFPPGNSLYNQKVYTVWHMSVPVSPDAPLGGWAVTWGGVSDDRGFVVATDEQGNSYVTGYFQGSGVDFDPGTGENIHSSNGGLDVFLSKFKPDGSLVWAKTWGGTSDDWGRGVGIDDTSLYVAGWFSGTVDFDPSLGGTVERDSNGSYDCFLSRFDLDGNFEWVQTWGGSDQEHLDSLHVDETGTVYAGGAFLSSSINLDPAGGDAHYNNGGWDCWLNKFSSDGTFQWGKSWGGPGDEGVNTIELSNMGNIYCTGSFQSTVNFDPEGAGDSRTAVGWSDPWLVCLDTSGIYQWARTWEGSAMDNAFDVCSDSSGDIYISGDFGYFFGGTLDINPGTAQDIRNTIGLYDCWLCKLDSSGLFIWGVTWGGNWGEGAYSLNTDASDNVYIAGYFRSDSVDFDPGDGSEVHYNVGMNAEADIFLMKLDSSSTFNWARTWGSEGQDIGFDVKVRSLSTVYLAGVFFGTVDFNPAGGNSHTAVGGEDVFLMRIRSDGYW